jgi:hypothetical protein
MSKFIRRQIKINKLNKNKLKFLTLKHEILSVNIKAFSHFQLDTYKKDLAYLLNEINKMNKIQKTHDTNILNTAKEFDRLKEYIHNCEKVYIFLILIMLLMIGVIAYDKSYIVFK